jgi:hypothetical protein
MIDKYLNHLKEKLDERVLQIQDSLAEGSAKDYPEYTKTCGLVNGLLTARQMITDLEERLKETDDD